MGSNYILLAFIFCITCYFNSIECDNSVIVVTNTGAVKGNVININNKTLNQFLGIPYAEPPVGSNRFGKPKPIAKWNLTIDATHEKNICWQSAQPMTQNQSEDCLTLHIWSENKTDAELRPVMFWIHGGGLSGGSGGANGMSLASFGVVTVSINYRLGVFGFLYGDDPSAPGNVGIYDQIMALQWINDNIHHFGGDKSQITLFGESAGSWSVGLHIVSPLSRNLFKRGIMQSGAYYFRNLVSYNNSLHLGLAKKTSQAVGCPDNDKWLDCMRKIEPKKILEHNSVTSQLVFGNEIFPQTTEESLKTGKFKTGIEVMAGVTDSEGTNLGAANVKQTFGLKVSNKSVHITKDEYKTQIQSMFKSNDGLADKLYDYFISHIDEQNQTQLRKAYIEIYSDTIITCPTYFYNKRVAQYSSANKVYFYELTYNSNHSGCHSEQWKGVCHADDLDFVFGNPIKNKSGFSETDYEFSVMVNHLWTNFAKTGNPLSPSVTNSKGVEVKDWPTFSPTSLKIMDLNPTNFGHVFIDPFHGSCDGVWKQYFGEE